MLARGFFTSPVLLVLLTGSYGNSDDLGESTSESEYYDGEPGSNPPARIHDLWTGEPKSQLLQIDMSDVKWSVSFAQEVISRLTRFEKTLVSSDVIVRRGTPAQGQLIDSYPGVQALQQGQYALIAVKASLFLAHKQCRRFGQKEDYCAKFVTNMKMNSTSLGDKCRAPLGQIPLCSELKYRSLNGSCNHKTEPSAGQALTRYLRLLPASYGDGIQGPRENHLGKALPSARLISTVLTVNMNQIEEDKTLALMQWTQFVEHDMSHTPVSKMANTGSSIMCCKPDGNDLKPRHVHPACFPISIPGNDPFFSRYRVHCMNYVRSTPAMRSDCSFGPKEQMNQVTHYLDGSMIYGITDLEALSLRQLSGGLLLEGSSEGRGDRGVLPLASQPTTECQVEGDSEDLICYRSGDIRVNAHPHLTAMHISWHREHNRVAQQLALLNPTCGDETLYQEARRIVVAEIQHITYTEWLPVVLGVNYMERLGISIKSGQAVTFKEDVDPSISNSFSTAAMRFVYSMMVSRLRLYDEQREGSNHTLLLKEHFYRPRTVTEAGHLDALIRGLATQTSQKNDMDYIPDMTNVLYQESSPYGMDIVSLDIQRGRDHGLPGYNHYRARCGLPRASSFQDFTDNIPGEIVAKLEGLYNHPDDVDLLIGGMAENLKNDSLLGDTFRCIVGEQFSRTMTGDHFFYHLQNQPHTFSPDQLRAIKNTTLARIFCDNGDAILKMQPDVFKKPSEQNRLTLCSDESSIPRVDLSGWTGL